MKRNSGKELQNRVLEDRLGSKICENFCTIKIGVECLKIFGSKIGMLPVVWVEKVQKGKVSNIVQKVKKLVIPER